ncbi:hypothetical protein BSNK01_31460 [Bacillaceae bacterium]
MAIHFELEPIKDNRFRLEFEANNDNEAKEKIHQILKEGGFVLAPTRSENPAMMTYGRYKALVMKTSQPL